MILTLDLVILAQDVIKVDVIPDFYDKFSAVVGTAGIMIALVALYIAVRADRKADRTLVEERRRVFELEVLRELAKDLDTGALRSALTSPDLFDHYRLRLRLLTKPPALWVRCLGTDHQSVMEALGYSEYRALISRATLSKDQAYRLHQFLQIWPIIDLQPAGTRANMVSSIEQWVPNPPAPDAPATEWQPIISKLSDEFAIVQPRQVADQAEVTKQRDEARAALPGALADDLETAINQLVDATHGQRPRLWFLLPRWWGRQGGQSRSLVPATPRL